MRFKTDFSRLQASLDRSPEFTLTPTFENFLREGVKAYSERHHQSGSLQVGYVQGDEALELYFGISADMPGIKKIRMKGTTTDLDLLKEIKGDLYAIFPGISLDEGIRQQMEGILGYTTLSIVGANNLRSLKTHDETRRRFSLPDVNFDLLKQATRIECESAYYTDQDPSNTLTFYGITFLKRQDAYEILYETYVTAAGSFLEDIDQAKSVFEKIVHSFSARTFSSQSING